MRKAFPFILLLLLASAQASAQGRACEQLEDCGLVVRGELTGLKVEKTKDSVYFHVDINVEFVNEGSEPIILFDPAFGEGFGSEGKYWLGGWMLYATEADAKEWKSIFKDGYWESVSGSKEYRALAAKLDVKTPPAGYTRTLQPREVWKTSDRFRIYFEAEKHYRYPELRTWKEMQEFSPRLWVRFAYELSPWNVEYFKPNLLRKLNKRWAAHGNVLVEKKKDGTYNSFFMVSEPMPIDLSQAKVKEPETKSEQ
jgi:hypothetical protein